MNSSAPWSTPATASRVDMVCGTADNTPMVALLVRIGRGSALVELYTSRTALDWPSERWLANK